MGRFILLLLATIALCRALSSKEQLWNGRASLTRELVVSSLFIKGELESVGMALGENAIQLGNEIALIYGAHNGTTFSRYLIELDSIMNGIIDDIVAGNDPSYLQKSYEQAVGRFATFLATIAHTNVDSLSKYLMTHIDLVMNELQCLQKGDYGTSLQLFLSDIETLYLFAEMI